MARHKNVDWNLPEGRPNIVAGGRTHDWASIHSALLMDLRDELQRLNALLHCSNFVGIPATLRAINRKTPDRKRKKRTVKS